MRIFCILLMAGSLYAQPWVMFNDMDDTYLYDQASGQVYIRVKKGGKNYEDTFVKMGVIDNLQNNSSKASLSAESIQDKNAKEASEDQRELLKKHKNCSEVSKMESLRGNSLGLESPYGKCNHCR